MPASPPGSAADGGSLPSTGETTTLATFEGHRAPSGSPPADGIERTTDPADPVARAVDDGGTAPAPGVAVGKRGGDGASRSSDPPPENKSGRGDDDDDDDDDDGSVGSLFDDAPSSLGTNEVKIEHWCASAPPPHSEVRSKKPKQLPHLRIPRRVQVPGVANASQVSGVTIPVALSRAPRRLPARGWEGGKPTDRGNVRSSAHRESKGERRSENGDVKVSLSDSTAASMAASGSKLGVELEIDSNFSPNQISEMTVAPPNSEQMLVLALKKYHQLTKKMAHPPPDIGRLIEKYQRAAHQQSAAPPPAHPPGHGGSDAEQQQTESPRALPSRKSLVPQPPPPRPSVPGPPPRGYHRHTAEQLATFQEIIVGVASILNNADDHRPQLQHQSQPNQPVNVQRRQRDGAKSILSP
jgi:hypothetical protein